MRLLHTSDWHLGARLGRVDRAPDHATALDGLFAVAEAERPDLILHTGDLFDAYRPPYEALQRGVHELGRLAKVAPTVVLAGNHDSPMLLRVLDEMASAAEPRRLWFVTLPQVLLFSDPVASVACVPFIPPGAIANYATDDPTRFEGNYADGIRMLNRRLLDEAQDAAGRRNVVLYAAHLHVQGARPGKSERQITVGDDYATHLDGLERALYCAFGHIHDPQLLPGGVAQGRYAGSLIQLDFGESQQQKHAVLVTIGDDVRMEARDLPGGRPLVDFSGSLAELEARAAEGGLDGCILRGRIDSEDPIPDLAHRVREWSPQCEVFNLINRVAGQKVKAIDTNVSDEREPAPEELFMEWRTNRATGIKAPDEAVAALFREALGAGPGVTPDFGVATLKAAVQETLQTLRTPERYD